MDQQATDRSPNRPRAVAAALLAATAFAGCGSSAVSVVTKPALTPASHSCSAAAQRGGAVATGVQNPTGSTPIYIFGVTLPAGWTAGAFRDLSSGEGMTASADKGTDFVNVSISATRGPSSAGLSTDLTDEVVKARADMTQRGYTVTPDAISCVVGGAPAVALTAARSTAGVTTYLYKILLIGYTKGYFGTGVDDMTFTIIGGTTTAADKEPMAATTKAIAASWSFGDTGPFYATKDAVK